jgi:HEAT repeat protein
LRSPDDRTRRYAAEGLGLLDDTRAIEPLKKVLFNESDGWTRYHIISALIKLRDPYLFDTLIMALDDGYDLVRSTACKGLGGLKDARAFEPLTQKLKDESYWVKAAAAEGLGELGDQQAIAFLVEVLTDEVYNVRSAAVIALGKLGDEQTIPVLTRVFRNETDENWYNRKVKQDISKAIKAIREREIQTS